VIWGREDSAVGAKNARWPGRRGQGGRDEGDDEDRVKEEEEAEKEASGWSETKRPRLVFVARINQKRGII